VTYSAEFGVSVGQWEYVHLTLSEDDYESFEREVDRVRDTLNNELSLKLGLAHAAIRDAILYGRDNPETMTDVEGPILDEPDSTSAMIMSELKAKVVETVTHDAPQKPWERPLKAAEPKAWESVQAAPSAPAVTGLEDF
jgi:hypothetical protein